MKTLPFHVSATASRHRQIRRLSGWVTLVVTVLALSVLIAFDRYMLDEEVEHVQSEADSRLLLQGQILRNVVEDRLHTNHILADRIALEPNLSQACFEALVQPIVANDPLLLSIEDVPNGVIRNIVPLQGHEEAAGFDLRGLKQEWPDIEWSAAHHQSVVGGPFALVEGGGDALILRTPVYLSDGRWWGMVQTLIAAESIRRALPFGPDGDGRLLYALRAVRAGKTPLTMAGDPDLFSKRVRSTILDFPWGRWELAAIPVKGWPNAYTGEWAWRGAALLVVVLLAWGTWVGMRGLGAMAAWEGVIGLLDGMEDVYYRTDGSGTLLEASPSVYALLGYRRDEVLGRPAKTLYWDRDEYERVGVLLRDRPHAPGTLLDTEVKLRHHDGSPRYVSIRTRVLSLDPDGGVAREGLIRDLTPMRSAEAAIRAGEKRLQAVFDSDAVAVVLLDPQGNLLRFNATWSRMLGHGGDVLGIPLWALVVESDQTRVKRMLGEVREQPGRPRREVVQALDTQGRTIWIEWSLAWVPPEEETDAGVIVTVAHDVTERKEAETHLNFMAHHDALTGLPNRAVLQDRLQMALIHARRRHQGVAVLFIDLDHFKPVNDRFGHEEGDRLLLRVAQTLEGLVRQEDTVARLGGDEFIVLLGGLNALTQAETIASKIVTALGRPIEIAGETVAIGASVGVAYYQGEDAEEGEEVGQTLIRLADEAMYRAKKSGRGRYEVVTRS